MIFGRRQKEDPCAAHTFLHDRDNSLQRQINELSTRLDARDRIYTFPVYDVYDVRNGPYKTADKYESLYRVAAHRAADFELLYTKSKRENERLRAELKRVRQECYTI